MMATVMVMVEMVVVMAGEVTEMIKTNIIIGLLALIVFANAQYQGWNLFTRDASQTTRLSGGSGRAYHK
jgi:hypothetical protein